MRWTPIVLVALLLPAFPLASIGAQAGQCTIFTYNDGVSIDDEYYAWVNPALVAVPELWRESNGIDGLQRKPSPCGSATPLPPDTCITHSENGLILTCVLSYDASP